MSKVIEEAKEIARQQGHKDVDHIIVCTDGECCGITAGGAIMMNWYWRVRIYNKKGDYWHGQIATSRNLREIDGIKDFYEILTGCKMLLEGMSEQEDSNLGGIKDAFAGLWLVPPAHDAD